MQWYVAGTSSALHEGRRLQPAWRFVVILRRQGPPEGEGGASYVTQSRTKAMTWDHLQKSISKTLRKDASRAVCQRPGNGRSCHSTLSRGKSQNASARGSRVRLKHLAMGMQDTCNHQLHGLLHVSHIHFESALPKVSPEYLGSRTLRLQPYCIGLCRLDAGQGGSAYCTRQNLRIPVIWKRECLAKPAHI